MINGQKEKKEGDNKGKKSKDDKGVDQDSLISYSEEERDS